MWGEEKSRKENSEMEKSEIEKSEMDCTHMCSSINKSINLLREWV